MSKGQISLDLLLAIIFALVILVGLNAVSEQATAMQKAVSVRQQLHATGMNVASALSTAAALNDGESGTTVAITPPLLAVPGEARLQQCDIKIADTGTDLNLSYVIVDIKTGSAETVFALVPFVIPSGMQLSPDLTATPGKCGGTIFAGVAP
ncbi:MAG: hypothetical protein NTW59_03170 [Candidatus Diapherotrites archaeon]|nr:hypothetical protein [Candidatus Diapherotrites archaeon]